MTHFPKSQEKLFQKFQKEKKSCFDRISNIFYNFILQVANAIMILVMIPLFNTVIYPLCAKCNLLTTSLQRIGLGFFMAALAFGVSGILDLELEVF